MLSWPLTTAMACMMFLWDYILTFGMEVNVVWTSKWNFMKGLYFFQRYLPFTEPIWLVLQCQFHMLSIFICSFFRRSIWGSFDGNWMLEGILRSWKFVKSTCLTLAWKVEKAYFASSIYDRWGCCIWEQVQPILLILSCTDWYITVILGLRTWAVWNRNQCLSIILPILYTLCWGSALVIYVRLINYTTCKWNFHAHSCFSGWFIAW